MSKRPSQIRTASDLAKALDVGPAQVSRWTRRADWPFRKAGPWKGSDLPKIQRWRAENLKPGAPERAANPISLELRQTKLTAEARKLNAQADAAETELMRQRGALVPIAEVQEEWERIGQRLRMAFANAPGSLVPIALTLGMPHTASAEFEQKTTAILNGILRVVSDAGRADTEDDPDAPASVDADSGALPGGVPGEKAATPTTGAGR